MFDHEKWINKAASDLRSAIKLSKDEDDTLDTAVYHTHQCVEKMLKAYLIFKKQNVPRTHDLEKLVELCSQFDDTFYEIRSNALDLQPYATYSRYPDDRFIIDRQEALESLKKSKNIFNFVKNKIEENPDPNLNIFG